MPDFIRLPSCILNLSSVRKIQFVDGSSVIVHWQGGETEVLTEVDTAFLLNGIENRYGLMTDPSARFWEEEEVLEEVFK